MDKFNRIKLFVYENKKRIIMGGCLVFVFLLVTFVLLKKDSFKTNKIEYENLVEEKVETNLLEKEEQSDDKEVEYFFVDVKGSVNNPGVYSLEKGKRVVDAINKAGGLKKDASTNLLNLSMEILDEMVIVVYSSNEINNLKETKEEETKTEVICTETIINDACICNNDTVVNGTGEDESNKNEVMDNTSNDKKEDPSKELVNINSAKLEVLMTLPSIGESKAKAIIEYREQNGPFKTIDDIKNVSGIGDKLFESIKDFITV